MGKCAYPNPIQSFACCFDLLLSGTSLATEWASAASCTCRAGDEGVSSTDPSQILERIWTFLEEKEFCPVSLALRLSHDSFLLLPLKFRRLKAGPLSQCVGACVLTGS